MHHEDTVKMFSAVFSYAKILADDIGKDKALEVMDKWLQGMAYGGLERVKRRLGITPTTLRDLYTCADAFDEEIGIWHEIEEETPEYIEHRVLNCMIPEACENTGWDCKEICDSVVHNLTDKAAKFLNPNLKWEIVEFNPNMKVGCKYRISYRDKGQNNRA